MASIHAHQKNEERDMKNMKIFKKLLALLTAGLMMILATGCGGSADTGNAGPAGGKRVGVSMPDKATQRWIQDGENVKQKLEALSYQVDLQYAEGDVQAQISQIENMITNGANCLVVAAVDTGTLANVLAQAKAQQIPVIAYDRLLMDTDGVSCYVTFDNKRVGNLMGKYVENTLGLAEGKGPYNIEFFAGSPDDNNAHLVNEGAFEVLQPYLDKGQLVCPSGQTSFDSICTLRWSQEIAQRRMEDLIAGYYTDGKKLDAVLSPADGISHGVVAGLEGSGYQPGVNWPVITGQDAEIMTVKNILSGKQSMSVFKDTRILADKCIDMVQSLTEGKELEPSSANPTDNHKILVPTYFCTPVTVDKTNLRKELVDSGYYTKEELGL